MQVVRERPSVMADKYDMYRTVKFHYRFVKFLYKKINGVWM